MSSIHVACQADGRFAPDCGVMLRSLLCENPDDVFIVHFLHSDALPDIDRARLAAVVRSFGSSWEPLRIGENVALGFPAMERYGGVTAWFRLLLPRLLEDVERVLYLDADLLVLHSVRGLWEQDLGSHCLAAVTNPLLGRDRRRVLEDLGLPDPGRYFNSGVMLMDLARLRDSGLMLEAERIARERAVPAPWADQEPLNAALWAHRLDLHPRWNVMNPCFDLPPRLLPWPPEQVSEAVRHPAIVHFVGPYKPWHYRLRHRYAHRYFEHLEQTPWHRRPQEGRTPRNIILRPLPPYVAMRYEMTEYALRRARRAGLPAGARLAVRALAGNGRLRAWLRAGRSLAAPPSTAATLRDVLDAVADSIPGACFLQIGSGDANHGDPLRSYVESRGWRGVLVEPVPYVFERLRSRYGGNPRLDLVNAAVGSGDAPCPFYYVAQSEDADLPDWYDEIGSFELANVLHPYHVANIPHLAERVVREEVRCLSFETLCREHPLPRLDVIHIDAEGHDEEILRQIDLMRLRPMLVLYEHKHLDDARARAAAEHLTSGGYRLLEVGPDTVAVRSDAPLLVRLALRRAQSRSGNSRRRFVPSGRL